VILRGRRQQCRPWTGCCLADVRAGRSRALVVRGEPGIGKTALLGYAVPIRRARHEALFEVEDGEPMGDGRPRFCLQLIDAPVVGADEEVFGLAETARIGQRNGDGWRTGSADPTLRWPLVSLRGALGFFGRVAVGRRRIRPRSGRPCRAGACGPADQMVPMLKGRAR
jgi:hypothetical protein